MPTPRESILDFSDERLHEELRRYEAAGGGTGYGVALRGEIARRAAERQTDILIHISRRLEIATWILAVVAVLTLATTVVPLVAHH